MWLQDYVGLPFAERGRGRDGVDCWGLACLVYADQLGIALPHHAEDYVSTADRETLQRLIAEGRSCWREIPCDAVREFDLVELSNVGVPHVGIAAGGGLMLHIEADGEAVIEPLGSTRIARRVRGYFRHASR